MSASTVRQIPDKFPPTRDVDDLVHSIENNICGTEDQNVYHRAFFYLKRHL
jgi:hypothetical protein